MNLNPEEFDIPEEVQSAALEDGPVNCTWCEEIIEPFDDFNGRSHRECFFRAMIGPLAHVQKRCSCYVPGSVAGDPEGLTLREAAIVAYDTWVIQAARLEESVGEFVM